MTAQFSNKSASIMIDDRDLLDVEALGLADALERRADMALEAEDWVVALEAFQRLSALLDRPGRNAYFLRCAARAQDYLTYSDDPPAMLALQASLKAWRAAHDLYEDHAGTLYKIGYTESEIGDLLSGSEASAAYRRALLCFEQSLVLEPDDAETNHMVAWICKTLGLDGEDPANLLARACRHYARACELDLDRAHSMEGWADALRGLAKRSDDGAARCYLNEAMSVLQRALRVDPGRAGVWHGLGQTRKELAMRDSGAARRAHLHAALRNYRRALDIDETRRNSQYGAGLCCYELGRSTTQRRSARHWYTQALAIAAPLRQRHPDFAHGLWLEVVATINYHRDAAPLENYLMQLERMAGAAWVLVHAGSRAIALHMALAELGFQFALELNDAGERWSRYRRCAGVLRRFVHSASDPHTVPELLARLHSACHEGYSTRRARLNMVEMLAFVRAQSWEGEQGKLASTRLSHIVDRVLDTAHAVHSAPARCILLDGLLEVFVELRRRGAYRPEDQNTHGRVHFALSGLCKREEKTLHLQAALKLYAAHVEHVPAADYAVANQGLALSRLAQDLVADAAEDLMAQACTFYDRALAIRADNRRTLSNYANLLLQRAAHAADAERDRAFSRHALDLLLKLKRGKDGEGAYNLACAYARLGRIPAALAALQRAKELGKLDPGWARSDPDLAPLHHLAQFHQLLE